MPITARAAVPRRAVLASVLAAAAVSLTACRDDGTGVRPIPDSSSPPDYAPSPHASTPPTPRPPTPPPAELPHP
ncbi:hypothetical protein [Streptomyces sclerotialus]|uniref:hypothetical protein n=1 Tax=Streptomyces sclerotialus TaxID=1957 RepID=UPI000AF91325